MSKSVKSDTKSKSITQEILESGIARVDSLPNPKPFSSTANEVGVTVDEEGTVLLRGRPSKYKSEYCDMLIAHMAKGFSFESFGALIDVDRSTLYYWEKTHREFLDAKGIARNKQLLHDEGLLMELARGEHGKSASANAQIYKMKCTHQGWIEKTQVEQTNKNIQINIDSDDTSL